MELKAAIQARRSIKSFDPNHRMTDDEIKTINGARHSFTYRI